ncbi:hypothetical protein [Nocardioides sp. NPDC000441]|uniref:hypothetical protein n=1 Tax=Nocardioides sp. NPDC000441 TaxID=3154256 RepID=UPI0033211140
MGSVGVFGGVALYIGWQRARIQAAAFGLSPSALGITDRDLAVSGVRSATVFLFILGAALLGAWAGHKLTLFLAIAGHRIAALALIAAAALLVLLQAVVATTSAGADSPEGDLMQAYGAACWLAFWFGLAYLCWAALLTHPRRLPPPVLSFLKWRHWGMVGAVGLLAVVFSLLESFATYTGRFYIGAIEAETSELTEVRLYAASDLALTGATINRSRLPRTENSAYMFIYRNLFLVGENDSAVVLIADGWHVDDPVFVVPKSPAIRMELVGGYPIRSE